MIFGSSEEEPSPQERLSTATTGATTHPADTITGEPDEPGGPREGLILLIFVIVTVAASAFVLWGDEQDMKNDPAAAVNRGEVHGLSELSMLREPNVKRVLDTVQKSKWPLVRNIRIAPERVDVQVSDKDGYQRRLSFDPAFKMTNDDDGVSEQNTLPASQIDPSAPERAVRGMAEKSGRSPDDVDYVTNSYLTEDDSDWYIALDHGPANVRQWVAEPDGRDVRHPGELSTAEQQAQDRQKREYERQQRRVQRFSQCMSGVRTQADVDRCYRKFGP